MNKETIKKNLIWAAKLAIGFVLFLILGSIAESPLCIVQEATSNQTVASCIIFFTCIPLSMLLFWLYQVWVRKVEKRTADELKWANMPSKTLRGISLGLTYFVSVVVIMVILGQYKVQSVQFNPLSQLSIIAFYLTVAACEEITFRGFLFRMIDERFGFWAATLISALLFGYVHITNDNATWWSTTAIVLEIGFFFGAYYKLTGSLWAPIGVHWIWNYTQGNIFGFAVSGNRVGESIITPILGDNSYITGGEFGAEASLIAAFLGMCITAYTIKKLYDKGLVNTQKTLE